MNALAIYLVFFLQIAYHCSISAPVVVSFDESQYPAAPEVHRCPDHPGAAQEPDLKQRQHDRVPAHQLHHPLGFWQQHPPHPAHPGTSGSGGGQ